MTKTLAITKLNTNSLKVEEIEALKEIADLLPDGTYLKSLFSTKLVEWAEQNILNDFPPDIMEAYTFSQKETEAAATQNQELQNDIYRKNRDLEHLRNMIENINQDRATTKSNFITSNKENCDLRVKVEILEERLETQAAEIQNMLRQHETEVMQLKARLYDLMTAKK